ncbi:MAG: hypothetical protein AAFQ79_01500 [Pseudomonadota bacterium]
MPEIFASRTFEIGGQAVECRFHKPERDGIDYSCQYEIDWPSAPVTKRAFGVDQVQALLMAMQKAHVELLHARDAKAMTVTWLEDENLSLPIPENVKDWAPKNLF